MPEKDHAMIVDVARARALATAIQSVSERVSNAAKNRHVRLVAVSKLKPASDILALHQAPMSQVHFGENYAQELTEKAQMLPKTIKWHFIGGLQSNKCKPLASEIPNLWCVSSVDSIKKADQLEKGRASLESDNEPLRIHIQVNTSGEESKSGAAPGPATLELCKHIKYSCPHLQLLGLMTIGAIARSKATTAETVNEDFVTLREERDRISKDIGMDLEASMGMSDDFEGAIEQGSQEVRVGSTIFGQRPAKADFKVKDNTDKNES